MPKLVAPSSPRSHPFRPYSLRPLRSPLLLLCSLLPAPMLLNNLYFRLKPLIPRSVRLGIRRWFVLRKRRQVQDVWPIMPGSERPPEGWPGWPDGKKFAFVLTHDVEGKQGVENCRQLAELEQKLGFRSSFNFVPEGNYTVPSALRSWLTDRGFEVGVHDLHHDGQLYSSREEFSQKAQRINEVLKEWGAVGFRSGYMLRNLEWIKELDIAYDASTFDTDPFEPQPDGVDTIFPFWGHSSGKRQWLRRAALHDGAGFDAVSDTKRKVQRALEEKAGLDCRASRDGAAQCAPRLHRFRRCKRLFAAIPGSPLS